MFFIKICTVYFLQKFIAHKGTHIRCAPSAARVECGLKRKEHLLNNSRVFMHKKKSAYR